MLAAEPSSSMLITSLSGFGFAIRHFPQAQCISTATTVTSSGKRPTVAIVDIFSDGAIGRAAAFVTGGGEGVGGAPVGIGVGGEAVGICVVGVPVVGSVAVVVGACVVGVPVVGGVAVVVGACVVGCTPVVTDEGTAVDGTPVVKGVAVDGTAVDGTAVVKGVAVDGTAVDGTPVVGGVAVVGTAVDGTAVVGGVAVDGTAVDGTAVVGGFTQNPPEHAGQLLLHPPLPEHFPPQVATQTCRDRSHWEQGPVQSDGPEHVVPQFDVADWQVSDPDDDRQYGQLDSQFASTLHVCPHCDLHSWLMGEQVEQVVTSLYVHCASTVQGYPQFGFEMHC